MATKTYTPFLLPLFFILSLTSFATSDTLYSSQQIKFWSENVQNQMPTSIIKKLSPLTQNQCSYYTNILSKNNDDNNQFTADKTFCSVAKLACSAEFNELMKEKNTYTTEKSYGQFSGTLSRHDGEKEDPFSFFRVSALKIGNSIHLPHLKDALPGRAFLPPQIASKMSLNLDNINKFFPESASGKIQDNIKRTLSYCNAAAIKGETKSCPKSLEEMISFSKLTLRGTKLLALTSKSTKGSNTELIVKNVQTFGSDKVVVACHETFLPFAAYFCHSLTSTHLYSVDFVDPKTRGYVNTMLAVCHFDTSPWPENHVALRILKFKPGQGEACHWFSTLDLAWVKVEGKDV